MYTINDELQEAFNAQLLNSVSLRIPFRSMEVQTMFLPADNNGSWDLPLSKSFTRASGLFVFLNQPEPANNFGQDKLCNSSYFPGGDATEGLEWYLQLGSRRMPDQNIRGLSETWYHAMCALGMGFAPGLVPRTVTG